MKTGEALIKLHQESSREDWNSWINALQNDPLIWETILYSDLMDRAMALTQEKLIEWTPARLVLFALDDILPLQQLNSYPMQPLEPDIRGKVITEY